MKYSFKHVDGRIILVTTIQVWGGDVTSETDVTDKLMNGGVVDDYLDYHLDLKHYKHTGTRLEYVGKDKDKYQK